MGALCQQLDGISGALIVIIYKHCKDCCPIMRSLASSTMDKKELKATEGNHVLLC